MQRTKFFDAIAASAFFMLGLAFPDATAFSADRKAGEQKATVCNGCHGMKGVSSDTRFPILAGQQPWYLVNQLKGFKNGLREGALMKNVALGLSDEDMENLAAYFASLQPISAGGDSELARIGEKQSAMCLGCHGTGAKGKGQFPRLAGQHPAYLVKQLIAFKTGQRKSNPMAAVTAKLSEQDIEVLAAYFGSL